MVDMWVMILIELWVGFTGLAMCHLGVCGDGGGGGAFPSFRSAKEDGMGSAAICTGRGQCTDHHPERRPKDRATMK